MFCPRRVDLWYGEILSNESSFAYHSGRIWVWGKPSQEFLQETPATVKYDCFPAMIWEAIWSAGRSTAVECIANINAAKYTSILQERLFIFFYSLDAQDYHIFHVTSRSLRCRKIT